MVQFSECSFMLCWEKNCSRDLKFQILFKSLKPFRCTTAKQSAAIAFALLCKLNYGHQKCSHNVINTFQRNTYWAVKFSIGHEFSCDTKIPRHFQKKWENWTGSFKWETNMINKPSVNKRRDVGSARIALGKLIKYNVFVRPFETLLPDGKWDCSGECA